MKLMSNAKVQMNSKFQSSNIKRITIESFVTDLTFTCLAY
jgi:hypothetical protein